jgi:hypothetical protein
MPISGHVVRLASCLRTGAPHVTIGLTAHHHRLVGEFRRNEISCCPASLLSYHIYKSASLRRLVTVSRNADDQEAIVTLARAPHCPKCESDSLWLEDASGSHVNSRDLLAKQANAVFMRPTAALQANKVRPTMSGGHSRLCRRTKA